MKILAINCGSSSIKYKLYETTGDSLLAKGLIEKIGEPGSSIRNHAQGIQKVVNDILKKKAISSFDEVEAIGHRVVHGAESFQKPQLINSKVIRKIKECASLAPLHNPANLAGILGCKKLFPRVAQVAVFDTAFHQTIPAHVYTYAIPMRYYKKYQVRKYGFHGTSHQFIAQQASRILKKPLKKLKLITCHLGNGCSITAIDRGKSMDTSMGFTPLEGLMMGTRCGDIDVAAVFYIMNREDLSVEQMEEVLNKRSGFLGVSGLSNDFRIVAQAMKKGHRLAKLAYLMFVHRLEKYIGAYYFILGGADAVCFTGGIGEHEKAIVSTISKKLKQAYGNNIRSLVIPTDEELSIVHLTQAVLQKRSKQELRMQ